MLLIGEDPKKYIDDYSQQFVRDFINLLKTTHGEKKIHINQFYQQVIADKVRSIGSLCGSSISFFTDSIPEPYPHERHEMVQSDTIRRIPWTRRHLPRGGNGEGSFHFLD